MVILRAYLKEVGEKAAAIAGGVGGNCAVKLHDSVLIVGQREGFVKLEVGRALEEFAHTVVLFHAGKLQKDLTVVFKLLDVGRYHTKLVDTGAEHIGRGAHAILYLLLESALHSLRTVAALGLLAEHHSEVARGIKATVFAAESAHIVVGLGGAHHRVGGMESRFKVRVAFGIGHRAEDVGHRYLKGDVHAALEVKAQPYAELLNFIESITEVDGLLGDGVDVALVGHSIGVGTCVAVALGCRKLLSVGLVMIGHHGKREIEQADEHQEYGYDAGYDTS